MNQTTFNVKGLLVGLENSARYAEMIIIESGLARNAKHEMNKAINTIRSVQKSLTSSMVDRELATLVRKEVSENEDNFAHENIRLMCLGLNNAQLTNIENYVEAVMNDKYKQPDMSDLNDLNLILNNTLGLKCEDRLEKLRSAGFDIVRENK